MTDDLDTADKDPSAPVDTPLQTPSLSAPPPRAAEPGPRPLVPKPGPRALAPKPGPRASAPNPIGPPSRTINTGSARPTHTLVTRPGVFTSDHLPLGQVFRLNMPRQLSIELPSTLSLNTPIETATNLTFNPLTPVPWEAYFYEVDFSDGEQLRALNQWRIAMIHRAFQALDFRGYVINQSYYDFCLRNS